MGVMIIAGIPSSSDNDYTNTNSKIDINKYNNHNDDNDNNDTNNISNSNNNKIVLKRRRTHLNSNAQGALVRKMKSHKSICSIHKRTIGALNTKLKEND